MQRAITGFHRDEQGDWVTELACGHRQHVRHRPPLWPNPWVEDAEARASRVGTTLDCPLCDRAELPEGLEEVRTTPVWDGTSMPAGLRRSHRVATGTWALLRVHDGRLRFRAATTPGIDAVLGPGDTQPIPPDVEHDVTPEGRVRFSLSFLAPARA
jgi:tellurite resistance-related uncharacterized protein